MGDQPGQAHGGNSEVIPLFEVKGKCHRTLVTPLALSRSCF